MKEINVAPICCVCGKPTTYNGDRLFFFDCKTCGICYLIPHPSLVSKSDLTCDCCQLPFYIIPATEKDNCSQVRSFVVCSNPQCSKVTVFKDPRVSGYVISFTYKYNCGNIYLLYNNTSVLSTVVFGKNDAITFPLGNFVLLYRWAKSLVNTYTQKALLARLGRL